MHVQSQDRQFEYRLKTHHWRLQKETAAHQMARCVLVNMRLSRVDELIA